MACNAKAHDFSVWCTYPVEPDIYVSGGDDAKLKVWDLREGDQSPVQSKR